MNFLKNKGWISFVLLAAVVGVIIWQWEAIKNFFASKANGGLLTPNKAQDPILQMGSKGRYVETLQGKLNQADTSLTRLSLDGDFGPLTQARLKALTGKTSIRLSELETAIKAHKKA